MPVSTDQLFVILLGAGDDEPNSYVFCVNRSIDDIALSVVRLTRIEGVVDYVKVERNQDDNGDDQTIIEIIFEAGRHVPTIFGRIAAFFADELDVSYSETLMFREIAGSDDPQERPLEFLRLTDYLAKSQLMLDAAQLTTAEQRRADQQVLDDLEASLKAS